MKLAVPVKSNGEIDQHFGHCEFYKIYTIEDNKLVSEERMESPKDCGCKSDIAAVFEKDGVSVLLAGGIGNGAVNILESHNVQVLRNCAGNVDTLVKQYLAGAIIDGGSNCDSHGGGDHECSH